MNLLKDLGNTLLLNILYFLKIIKYPISILPRKKYKAEIDIDKLLNSYNIYIVRRSDLDKDSSINTAGKLKYESIGIERLPFLSSNLLGGHFKADHTKYSPVKGGASNWEAGDVDFFKFKNDFLVKNGFDAILIPVKELHNIDVPFSAPNSKDNSKRLKLPFEPKNNSPLIGHGLAQIRHSPTMLNYWHVELIIMDFDKKAIKKVTNAFNENACTFIFDIISEKASFNKDVDYIIKDHFYLN